MKIRSFTISFVVIGLIAGCATMLPHVTPGQASQLAGKWPDMTVEKYEEARTLYTNRCSGCHNLILPKKLTLAKWQPMLDKMAPKARINAEQKELLWRYIAAAKEVVPEATKQN